MTGELDYFQLVPPEGPSNGEYKVALPPYLRDQAWADAIGEIQAGIFRLMQDGEESACTLIIDFTKCRWIDPLPLMSILLEIFNARGGGVPVEIRLPDPDGGPEPTESGPYQRSANRILWFLNDEGFFDSLDILTDDQELIYPRRKSRNVFRSLRVTPSYEDAHCIPLTLLSVPSESEDDAFAQQAVERLLTGIDSKLDSKISPQTKERLTYKLRAVLQEALHNTQEHAYPGKSTQRLMAIYVRYRIGGIGLDTNGREIFDKHIKEERAHCPGLYPDWLSNRTGCLEVFVIDRGIGMVKSFIHAGKELNNKYKFDEAMKETFLDGRSSKQDRETAYGGLHLLHNLLSETGDHIRGLEDGLWFASTAPILRDNANTRFLTANEGKVQGLAMHFRLAWKTETDYGGKWAAFSQGKESEVWTELAIDSVDCESSFEWFEGQTVFDERLSEETTPSKGSSWMLWLVRQHRMKWDILSYLERIIAPTSPEKATLIIADIPSYEAETYAAALGEYSTHKKNRWPAKFERIILCTNRLRFATVEYEDTENRHGFSKLREDFTELTISPPKILPRPKNFRLGIVRWLKWYDSKILWEKVKQFNGMFIPEKVLWGVDNEGKDNFIDGYLDFARTARDPFCAEIYRAALARILGILPPHQVSMRPLDLLTMTVLRDIHTSEVYEPATLQPTIQLALGSVLVSGSTLDASIPQGQDLHFFIHNSSRLRGKKCSLLYWVPKIDIRTNAQHLERIGRTATIAPNGWKSFEVPRFDADNKTIGARTPQKTYADWQSSNPVIVKSGHWSYQGHHDFITINIAGALDAAFLEKNELARFLIQRIFPFIGLTQEHMKENCRRLLQKDGDRINRKPSQEDYGLLVYRSHPSTESVIKMLLETLTKEGKELAGRRIFPILPVRMRWSGSTMLIPPLIREEIKSAMQHADSMRPVLIFDDAAITGRTLQDLRCALSSIGAPEVSTMVIANRLRQPSDGKGALDINYYWRMDVPVMGRAGNCPLCHAIDLAKEFIGALASRDSKIEINSWAHEWEAVSPIENWNRGLRPLPLHDPELEKKYCCRLDSNSTLTKVKYLTTVDVIRSTGLVINVSELHAMTGRDDYSIKKLLEHKEAEVRIELASSQLLLFGSEFDADVRIILVKVLIHEMGQLKEGSPHTRLAGLGAIFGLALLDTEGKERVVSVINAERWSSPRNYACRVLLAYLVKSNLLEIGSEPWKVGIRLLSTEQLSHTTRLRAIFLETLSPLGNSHSEAIPTLLELLRFAGDVGIESIQDALDSIEHLSDLIHGLDRALARKDARTEYERLIKDWNATSELVIFLLREERKIDGSRDWSKLILALEIYLESIKTVANAYFHLIHSAVDYYKNLTFESAALTKIIGYVNWSRASDGKCYANGSSVESGARDIRISPAGEVDFDCNAGEVWIPWYQGIPIVILDMVRNAVYASEQMVDPWESQSDDIADMWIKVDYHKKFVCIQIANRHNNSGREWHRKLKVHRWHEIFAIGGKVHVLSDINNVVIFEVIIPYAAYLNGLEDK